MITDPVFYFAAVPAVIFFGIAKGGFGSGLGILAVPLMAMVISPIQAAAILLPILCVMDLHGLWAYRGKWIWPELRILLPASLIGIVAGALLFEYMSPSRLRLLLGVIAVTFTGLGAKLITQLVEAEMVKDPADLYALEVEPVAALERMGQKSAENVVAGIARSKTRPLHNFLNGLAVRHVGERISELLAQRYKSLDALLAATEEELLDVDEVGPEVATSLRAFLEGEENAAMLQRLQDAGVDPQPPEEVEGGVLSGEVVVFTGKLEILSRDGAKALAQRHGATVGSSVTQKTTLVVAGPGAGSKLKKAKELEIEVLEEQEFLDRVGRE